MLKELFKIVVRDASCIYLEESHEGTIGEAKAIAAKVAAELPEQTTVGHLRAEFSVQSVHGYVWRNGEWRMM